MAAGQYDDWRSTQAWADEAAGVILIRMDWFIF